MYNLGLVDRRAAVGMLRAPGDGWAGRPPSLAAYLKPFGKLFMPNFAYGSNMSLDYVHDYCPSARFKLRAKLPNFHIEFRCYSTDLRGGISSIIEAPGEMVHGVIYDIESEEIEALDILEDVPLGLYRRDSFLVFGEDGQWHRAELYRVSDPAGPFAPARRYVEWMIAGANMHGLDADYIEKLVALRADAQ